MKAPGFSPISLSSIISPSFFPHRSFNRYYFYLLYFNQWFVLAAHAIRYAIRENL